MDLAELLHTFLGPESPTLATTSHGRVVTMGDFPQVLAQGLGSEHLAAAQLLTAPMGGTLLLYLLILDSHTAIHLVRFVTHKITIGMTKTYTTLVIKWVSSIVTTLPMLTSPFSKHRPSGSGLKSPRKKNVFCC